MRAVCSLWSASRPGDPSIVDAAVSSA